MAQTDTAADLAATYFGVESAFAVTPAMTRGFPELRTFDLTGLAQEELRVADERTYGFAHIAPVKGLKSTRSQIKFQFKLREDGTQLGNSTAQVTHWAGQIFQAGFGGANGASSATSFTPNTSGQTNGGSLVAAAGSSTTAIVVAGGNNVRFASGQWVGVVTSQANLEFCRLSNIVPGTDTLTPYPSLIGTPVASTGVVYNSYTYSPGQQNSVSLTIQHAKTLDTNAQWTLNGCMITEMVFAAKVGEEISCDVTARVASWTGPSSQAISTAAAADTMTAPQVALGNTYLQAFSTLTRTSYPLHAIELKLTWGMMFLPEYAGTQGVTGIFRIPTRPFGTGTITFREDLSRDTTDWVSRNVLNLIAIYTTGTGATTRATVLDIPGVIIVGKPMQKNDGGRLVTVANFEMLQDANAQVNSVAGTNDLQLAPFRLALI